MNSTPLNSSPMNSSSMNSSPIPLNAIRSSAQNKARRPSLQVLGCAAIALCWGLFFWGDLASGNNKKKYPLGKVQPTAKTVGRRDGGGSRAGDLGCILPKKKASQSSLNSSASPAESKPAEPKIAGEYLVALAPQFAPRDVGGGTSQARPNFWFYINATGVDCKAIFELSLASNGQLLHRQVIPLTNVGGQILKVPTPQAVELSPNTTYFWKMTVEDSKDRIGKPAQGYIHRQAAGEEDLWFDDLNEKIQQYRSGTITPEQWTQFWVETWPSFRANLSPAQIQDLEQDAAFLSKRGFVEP
jgi:Domain of Unknown Function (DUF928)